MFHFRLMIAFLLLFLAGGAPRAEEKKIDKKQLQALWLQPLWSDLISEDGIKSFRAMGALTNWPALSVPFLDEQLRLFVATAPAHPDDRRTARLIADLDAEDYPTREKASQELEKHLDSVAPALQKALADKRSLEFRMRLEQLLAKKGHLSPSQLRVSRAIEVLERISTTEAQKVLANFAETKGDSRMAAEARASLKRLRRLDG